MGILSDKLLNKDLRAKRVRTRVSGTPERPRLSVNISNKHVSLQLIDDIAKKTLASASTVGAKITGTMTEKATWVGAELAKNAKKAKITKVVFDRGSRKYAKRVAALAEAARNEGLEF